MENNTLDINLAFPFSMVVTGPSMSGKTTFVLELLRRRNEILAEPVEKVFYYYTEYQPVFNNHKDIIFINSIEDLEAMVCNNCIVVYDDCMESLEGTLNKYIKKVFTRQVHHANRGVIILLQNAFCKNLVSISRNATYLVLGSFPYDKLIISNIARRVSPGNIAFIIDAYNKVTREGYGFLIFDFARKTPDRYKIRSSFFPEDMLIFRPE